MDDVPRVLIVEDEAIVARDIQLSLRRLGYDAPTTVSNGSDALSAAEREAPDIVLMDINLKGPMDGIEAAEGMRDRGVPVIFLTAYADEETLQRAKVAEPHGYLLKPFDERDLRTAIEVGMYRQGVESTRRGRSKLLESMMAAMPEIVVGLDAEGRVAFINDAGEQAIGLTSDEVRGKRFSEVCRSESSERMVHDAMARSFADGEDVEIHGVDFRGPVGTGKLKGTVSSLPGNGGPDGCVIVLHGSGVKLRPATVAGGKARLGVELQRRIRDLI